jgi:predicted nucleic acid-binding protein
MTIIDTRAAGKRMIVLDASIAAKWLLPEPGSQAALELQEGPEQLLAPDLIRLEVAAAITRRARAEADPLAPSDAASCCARWLQLLDQAVLSLIPEAELLQPAVALSAEIQHSLQDCLYLTAARQLDAPLITADKAFQNRAVRFYKKISLLPGCSSN